MRFELWEVLRGVFGGGPRICKLGGIPIADDGVFLTFRSFPTAMRRRAIGEMPGEDEFVIGGGMRGESALETERTDGAGFIGLRTKFAIGREIVPKQEGRIPPAASRPTFEMSERAVGLIENGEREAAAEDIVLGECGIGHLQTGESGGSAKFVGAFVAFADRVIQGPGDGDVRGLGVGIGDAITEDGHGEAGVIGIVRNEGREGFERDVDGEGVVGEIDAGERKFAGEAGGGETRKAWGVGGAETVLPFVGRLVAGFENMGDRRGVADLRPDGRERIREVVALVGTIEDFPIAKLAAATETERAGSDTTEGERKHGELAAGEGAGIGRVDGGYGREMGGCGDGGGRGG